MKYALNEVEGWFAVAMMVCVMMFARIAYHARKEIR
jgi:hypothetical protein